MVKISLNAGAVGQIFFAAGTTSAQRQRAHVHLGDNLVRALTFLRLRFHSTSRATSWRNCSDVTAFGFPRSLRSVSRPAAGLREISTALPSARTRTFCCGRRCRRTYRRVLTERFGRLGRRIGRTPGRAEQGDDQHQPANRRCSVRLTPTP